MANEIFPKWKPGIHINAKFGSSDQKIAYKALRCSSASFIKKKEVRDFIFNRDGHKCSLCPSTEMLQVDHIISVYRASKEKELIRVLNTEANLTTLCQKCNSKKSPTE